MLYQSQNPHGGDLYTVPVSLDFSSNTNPFGTPQAVRDAVRDVLDALHHYPDPYCRDLVRAIAAHEGVPESCILCGNGAAELIFAYCRAVQPGKALLLGPSFSEYKSALEETGCEIEYYRLSEGNDFRLTEEFLDTLRCTDAQMLMLCSPNNPTGALISRALLEKICDICRARSVHLFLDECFIELSDSADALSIRDRLAAEPNLFLLKAFTKNYGMAGLRLGYCMSSDAALLQTMGKSVQPWNVSVPAQAAGIAALGQTQFLQKARELIFAERERQTEKLKALGLRVIPSQTNYILFHSAVELKAPLLRRGILLRSCDNYVGLGEGWYRVAIKLPEENEQLIKALTEVLHG